VELKIKVPHLMPLEGTSQKMKEAVVNTNPITHRTPQTKTNYLPAAEVALRKTSTTKTQKEAICPLTEVSSTHHQTFPQTNTNQNQKDN
jgi:hypothetical protein